MVRTRRLAVIGGGWSGLAAAVEAVAAGHQVSLFEMARELGGRARRAASGDAGLSLDNGQHILIGAYSATLALMREVGVSPEAVLHRQPLALLDAQGRGLRLPAGPALPAFVRAVLALSEWPVQERLRFLATAGGWLLRRFQCPPDWTVEQLTSALPLRARLELTDPLCVAALNTPAAQASAQVFLRVLRDALFAGPGAADLLLPRRPLAALLPEPAIEWLHGQGARVELGRRAERLDPDPDGWRVDGEPCDAVILACSASEAARLTAAVAPVWSAGAGAFSYEPIVTVALQCDGARLAAPMVALPTDAPEREPAQFAFDLGAICGAALAGRFTYVVSGAAPWIARGLRVTEEAVRVQAAASLSRPSAQGGGLNGLRILRTIAEKRATFRCTPGLQRPTQRILPRLWAAGDYVEGPYPATLEGAVRSGVGAASAAAAAAPGA